MLAGLLLLAAVAATGATGLGDWVARLAFPQTRIWGVVLAVLVTFAAEITLLKNEQYMWSVPGIVLMIALVPAALAI